MTRVRDRESISTVQCSGARSKRAHLFYVPKICQEARQDNEQRPFPLYRKLAFASGHFLNVLGISMWFPYNVSFFEKVLGIPPKNTGTIILIAQVFGALSNPFVGMWSDQTRVRYGRRKVFHLVGVIAIACSFFFVRHQCIGCENTPHTYQVLYFASVAIVF